MRILPLKSKIFNRFPEVRTFFTAGKFNFGAERKRLLKKIHFRRRELFLLEQIHSDRMFFVADGTAIDFQAKARPRGDGLVAGLPNIFLAVRSADCLPILFYCPKAGAVGAVHAGWKGTYKQILKKTVKKTAARFKVKPADFYFYLGPAARACHYEITDTPERAHYFKGLESVLQTRRGKLFLDFVNANYLQLRALGVPKSHIEDSGFCTIHDKRFPSRRRQGLRRHETLLSIIGTHGV